MSECFVSLCNHRFDKRANGPSCKAIRFPVKDELRKKWDKLCRRADRKATFNDRICSCHFEDGKKENGPTMFPWNVHKPFTFPSPEKRCRNKKLKIPEAEVTFNPPSVTLSNRVTVKHDHGSYCHPCDQEKCVFTFTRLNGMIKDLKQEINALKEEIEECKKQVFKL